MAIQLAWRLLHRKCNHEPIFEFGRTLWYCRKTGRLYKRFI